MEYKKQYRWFAFLIIPFIVLFLLHFLIPLEFILNSYPLAQLKYNTQKIQDQQTTIRSLLFKNANIMESIVQKYDQISIRIINLLKNQGKKYFKASLNTPFSNAFLLNQGLSLPINQSMWYSGSSEKYQQLSVDLKNIYERYLTSQLYFRHYLSRLQLKALMNICTQCLSNQNNQIIFLYPARKNPEYNSLNLINITKNLTNILFENQEQLVYVTNNTIIRQLLLTTQKFKCSVMVQLSQQILLKQLQQSIVYLDPITKFFNRYILFNPSSSVRAQSKSQYNYYPIFNSSNNKFDNISFLIQNLIKRAQESHFTKKFMNNNHINLIHIDPQIGLQQFCLYLAIIEIDNSQIQVRKSLDQNKIIVPLVILITISSILSALILKKLLASIQLQLFQLGKCCSFIVQGDINIQIPNYQGTKDIKQVYQQVKIINKLHRYSTDSYFQVHFSEKVVRYHQAIQFLKKLGYEIDNGLQNIGQSCIHVQNWQIAIPSLIQSIQIMLEKIKIQYGTIDHIMKLKYLKKLPSGYKQMQLILIRRLFKLSLAFLRYFQFRPIHMRKTSYIQNQQSLMSQQQKYFQQNIKYMNILKKAFYPDAASFSQSIIAHLNQAKRYASNKKSKQAQQSINKASLLLDQYTKEYTNIGIKLKQKEQKNKLFHKKHKLTAHSRATPSVLSFMRDLWKSKIILMNNDKPQTYLEALDLLINACKAPIVTIGMYYMILMDIRKIVNELQVSVQNFQTTQIFRQAIPFKSLYYGQITKQKQKQLLKVILKTSPGLQRQYILIYDCSRDLTNGVENKYFDEINNYLIKKLIKKTDRVSIIKCNLKNGNQIVNNLILKQQNEVYLINQMKQCLNIQKHHKTNKNNIFQQISFTIHRISKLKSQKIIIVYFHPLSHYKLQLSNKLKKQNIQCQFNLDCSEFIIQIMNTEGLRNCKVIMMLSEGDQREAFIQFFGLWQINRRIWNKTNGINTANNLVYIIEQKHKTDLDRILMIKIQENANNHVFIL